MNQNSERITIYTHPGSVEKSVDYAVPWQFDSLIVAGATEVELEDIAPQTSLVLRRIAADGARIEYCSLDSVPNVARPTLFGRIARHFPFFFTLARKLRTSDAVCVVPLSDRLGLGPAMIALILARFLGKHTVLDCTAFYVEPALEEWCRLLVPLMRCANRILVTSPSLAERIGQYGLDALGVGPLVDTTESSHRVVQVVQPKLLSALPLEPSMNVGCVLRAFRLVKQKYPRAELMIAGEGSQREALESMIAAERIGSVSFLGPVCHNELKRRCQEADMFIAGVSRDDLPYPLFEALASGLPIVTTDAGAIPDYLTEAQTCLMVPLNNHVAMADKVIALIEDPDLTARLSRNGRRLAEQFSWERKGPAFRALYFRRRSV